MTKQRSRKSSLGFPSALLSPIPKSSQTEIHSAAKFSQDTKGFDSPAYPKSQDTLHLGSTPLSTIKKSMDKEEEHNQTQLLTQNLDETLPMDDNDEEEGGEREKAGGGKEALEKDELEEEGKQSRNEQEQDQDQGQEEEEGQKAASDPFGHKHDASVLTKSNTVQKHEQGPSNNSDPGPRHTTTQAQQRPSETRRSLDFACAPPEITKTEQDQAPGLDSSMNLTLDLSQGPGPREKKNDDAHTGKHTNTFGKDAKRNSETPSVSRIDEKHRREERTNDEAGVQAKTNEDKEVQEGERQEEVEEEDSEPPLRFRPHRFKNTIVEDSEIYPDTEIHNVTEDYSHQERTYDGSTSSSSEYDSDESLTQVETPIIMKKSKESRRKRGKSHSEDADQSLAGPEKKHSEMETARDQGTEREQGSSSQAKCINREKDVMKERRVDTTLVLLEKDSDEDVSEDELSDDIMGGSDLRMLSQGSLGDKDEDEREGTRESNNQAGDRAVHRENHSPSLSSTSLDLKIDSERDESEVGARRNVDTETNTAGTTSLGEGGQARSSVDDSFTRSATTSDSSFVSKTIIYHSPSAGSSDETMADSETDQESGDEYTEHKSVAQNDGEAFAESRENEEEYTKSKSQEGEGRVNAFAPTGSDGWIRRSVGRGRDEEEAIEAVDTTQSFSVTKGESEEEEQEERAVKATESTREPADKEGEDEEEESEKGIEEKKEEVKEKEEGEENVTAKRETLAPRDVGEAGTKGQEEGEMKKEVEDPQKKSEEEESRYVDEFEEEGGMKTEMVSVKEGGKDERESKHQQQQQRQHQQQEQQQEQQQPQQKANEDTNLEKKQITKSNDGEGHPTLVSASKTLSAAADVPRKEEQKAEDSESKRTEEKETGKGIKKQEESFKDNEEPKKEHKPYTMVFQTSTSFEDRQKAHAPYKDTVEHEVEQREPPLRRSRGGHTKATVKDDVGDDDRAPVTNTRRTTQRTTRAQQKSESNSEQTFPKSTPADEDDESHLRTKDVNQPITGHGTATLTSESSQTRPVDSENKSDESSTAVPGSGEAERASEAKEEESMEVITESQEQAAKVPKVTTRTTRRQRQLQRLRQQQHQERQGKVAPLRRTMRGKEIKSEEVVLSEEREEELEVEERVEEEEGGQQRDPTTVQECKEKHGEKEEVEENVGKEEQRERDGQREGIKAQEERNGQGRGQTRQQERQTTAETEGQETPLEQEQGEITQVSKPKDKEENLQNQEQVQDQDVEEGGDEIPSDLRSTRSTRRRSQVKSARRGKRKAQEAKEDTNEGQENTSTVETNAEFGSPRLRSSKRQRTTAKKTEAKPGRTKEHSKRLTLGEGEEISGEEQAKRESEEESKVERVSEKDENDTNEKSKSGTSSGESNETGERTREKLGLRRRTQKLKIIFTGISVTPTIERKVKKLGGAIVASPLRATHLITCPPLLRTTKLLAACSCCRFILDHVWLDESARMGAPLDEQDFVLRDAAAEHKWGFSLQDSLHRQNPFLKGYKVFILPSDDLKPAKEDLKLIVEAAGGKVVGRAPAKASDRLIVVAAPSMAQSETFAKLSSKGFAVHTPELLLVSALRQSLDLSEHTLSNESSTDKETTAESSAPEADVGEKQMDEDGTSAKDDETKSEEGAETAQSTKRKTQAKTRRSTRSKRQRRG